MMQYTSTTALGGSYVVISKDGVKTITVKENAIEIIKDQPFFPPQEVSEK